MPDVVRSIEIQAPPVAVWRWFGSEAALRRWISPTLEIDLRIGGHYRLTGPDASNRISGTVLELVPEERLVLSWLEEDAGWVNPARLELTLTPSERGTTVMLVHDGFEGVGTPRWSGIADAYERGADRHRVLERLAELVTDAA